MNAFIKPNHHSFLTGAHQLIQGHTTGRYDSAVWHNADRDSSSDGLEKELEQSFNQGFIPAEQKLF